MDMAYEYAKRKIEDGKRTGQKSLSLRNHQLTALPPEIGQLTSLTSLDLSDNQLSTLPPQIGQLTTLTELDLSYNQLTVLPPEIGQLTALRLLNLWCTQLTVLPPQIGQLTALRLLYLSANKLTALPPQIGQLTALTELDLSYNKLITLPSQIGQLTALASLELSDNKLIALPPEIGQLTTLTSLNLWGNKLIVLPPEIGQLTALTELDLRYNPLNPALQSAYNSSLASVFTYLQSLSEEEDSVALYEAKLVLIGEGNVGKTSLLKAMKGEEPRKDEETTHGMSVDIDAFRVSHPTLKDVRVQFNTWDFGGQKVYRVTHQFFFSPRAIYLLLWNAREGVEQCQVEAWLEMLQLRVGDEARVIIVATHCQTGERIARIDKPYFEQQFGKMIVGFHEVDSLVKDEETGAYVGVAALKTMIAEAVQQFDSMGMELSKRWLAARDQLLDDAEAHPRITYNQFTAICEQHGLDQAATDTLAILMHDLGYIVYYHDDEALRDDVVLQPEWLTKAIGFVLEDRETEARAGILPDDRLQAVWRDHSFKNEPRYDAQLYPFFLRLMERFDVSYRLQSGTASLVAQHVPQVQPDLPWHPYNTANDVPAGQRRPSMVCVMEENPPGLVPWMIVRTHPYAVTPETEAGNRLHWQKGMFLRHQNPHGEALLEYRPLDREFHVHTQSTYPEYFMVILRDTLQQLITEKWPGLKDRYFFAVPCLSMHRGKRCDGRFDIDSLHVFLNEGDTTIRCQVCRQRQDITRLLFGFEQTDERRQLARIEQKLGKTATAAEVQGMVAKSTWTLLHGMANEAKFSPRLFTIFKSNKQKIWKVGQKSHRLCVWCEAEGHEHPVWFDQEAGSTLGMYEFDETDAWLKRFAPYLNVSLAILRVAAPISLPSVKTFFGDNGDRADQLKRVEDELTLAKEFSKTSLVRGVDVRGRPQHAQNELSDSERSGLLALQAFLREHDPTHANLGLKRVATKTGDFRWLCAKHYEAARPKIPDVIVPHEL